MAFVDYSFCYRFIPHQSNHLPVYVERRHNFRKRQVLRNTLGHTDLINPQIGICCDNRTAREVHSLSHEVATNTTFFTLETQLDGFEGAT